MIHLNAHCPISFNEYNALHEDHVTFLSNQIELAVKEEKKLIVFTHHKPTLKRFFSSSFSIRFVLCRLIVIIIIIIIIIIYYIYIYIYITFALSFYYYYYYYYYYYSFVGERYLVQLRPCFNVARRLPLCLNRIAIACLLRLSSAGFMATLTPLKSMDPYKSMAFRFLV
jgi:hypothetical protein